MVRGQEHRSARLRLHIGTCIVKSSNPEKDNDLRRLLLLEPHTAARTVQYCTVAAHWLHGNILQNRRVKAQASHAITTPSNLMSPSLTMHIPPLRHILVHPWPTTLPARPAIRFEMFKPSQDSAVSSEPCLSHLVLEGSRAALSGTS